MVIETLDLLCVWWRDLKECQKIEISIHLGHLPSIMDFKVCPEFIEVITRFWDDKRMVFFIWGCRNNTDFRGDKRLFRLHRNMW